MDIEILLASGESDTIRGIDDTLVEENYLHILKEIESDSVPAGMKTVTVTRPLTLDEESQLRAGTSQERKPTDGWKVPGYVRPHLQTEPTATKTQTYQLVGTYAPGMWMKVMYA